MPVSDVLKKVRKDGYGGSDEKSTEEKQSDGPRTITLTDDEQKEIGSYGEAGLEVQCLVTGKLEDGHLHVMSVKSAGGDEEGAGQIAQSMQGPPPMMQGQTLPSPS